MTAFRLLILITLLLGIFFRFVNLDYKVYWYDEVITSFRAAGYSSKEVDHYLFQNRLISAQELLTFQRIKPESTAVETIYSLALEDPQHPPFYFLLARVWMQIFGSSLTASRMLPAILSLLGLPLIYALGMELFASRWAALLATAFLALSPFDILFAQTARQYSLLTVLTIASSWLLVRAIRLLGWKPWVLYAIASVIGLYTHPFFILVLIAHGVYVLLLGVFLAASGALIVRNCIAIGVGYGSAIALSSFLYIPWLVVLIENLQQASSTTNWTREIVSLDYLIKFWTLSFTSLFLDLDFGLTNPLTVLIRMPIVLLIFTALYIVFRRTLRSTWLFIFSSLLVPFLLLALPDILSGGKRSTVSRYLIACFPAIQLTVAYFFSVYLQTRRWIWWCLGLVLTSSVVSCTVSAFSDTGWSKGISASNSEYARIINTTAEARGTNNPLIVISDNGDEGENKGQLISLSYKLNPGITFLLVGHSLDLSLFHLEDNPIVHRPSAVLRTTLEQKGLNFERIYKDLWHLKQSI